MAFQRNSLRRSRSVTSLTPKIVLTRCSSDQLQRSNSSTNLKICNADEGPSSSTKRFVKQTITPLNRNQRIPLQLSSTVKDTRPLTDKKWQHAQLYKLKCFFADYPFIVNNLKPLTIQSFIEAINILFAHIDDRIIITTKNYKDLVPSYMELLRYPATISQSLLKCVNTLHSWPQVIGILSWLVDFINNIYKSPIIIEHIRDESELYEPIKNYLYERYVTWFINGSEEDVDRKFQIKLNEIFGINENDYLKLKNNVENLETQYSKCVQEEKELKEKLAVLKNEMQTKKEAIDSFRNRKTVPAEEKYQQMLKQIEDMDKTILEKRNRIEELKETISKQPSTIEELKERKRDIELMKYNLQLQYETMEKWNEIINDCNNELTHTKRKLLKAIFKQNIVVMNYEHFNPLIKNLELQETDFAQIKDEVDRVSKLQNEYYQKFMSDLHESKRKFENTTNTYTLLKKKYESIKDEWEKKKQISKQLDAEIKLYEQKSDEEIEALLKEKNKLVEWYTYLLKKETQLTKEFDVFQSQTTTAEENLKLETENNEELQKNVLNFFVQLQNSIMNNFMVLDEKKNEMKEKVVELLQKNLEEQLHIREELRKMYNLND